MSTYFLLLFLRVVQVQGILANLLTFFQSTYQTLPSPFCVADAVINLSCMGPISGAHITYKDGEGEPGHYIYRPPQVPLDVEGYPVAPAGLELEQVHIYVRHGAYRVVE